MSLRRVLLVDDSRAILAYESAALSGLYAVVATSSVNEALEQIERLIPALVLLDLSMPERDGDELLAIMQSTPDLARVPVVIVSSEQGRAAECLERGAVAFLPKPIRSDELRATVARVLSDADRRATDGSIGVLIVDVGAASVGLPLDDVRAVLLQPLVDNIELVPGLRCAAFDFHGRRAHVLATNHPPIGDAPRAAYVDRKLVLFERRDRLFALTVDEIVHPSLYAADALEPMTDDEGETAFGVRDEARGLVRIIDPAALVSTELWSALGNSDEGQA